MTHAMGDFVKNIMAHDCFVRNIVAHGMGDCVRDIVADDMGDFARDIVADDDFMRNIMAHHETLHIMGDSVRDIRYETGGVITGTITYAMEDFMIRLLLEQP